MARCQEFSSAEEALADIPDGAVIMVAGYGGPGTPYGLVTALLKKAVTRLTYICGPLHGGDPNSYDASRLVASGRVDKLITAAPMPSGKNEDIARLRQEGRLQVELGPQGTLTERIRAGGAGLGGVFLSTGIGTAFEEGKERRVIDGEDCLLETPLRADYALLRARVADTLGNLAYHRSQRNWNPIMAMAADVAIVEVDEVVAPGELDPELVITPGIYVNRLIPAQRPADG